MALPSYLYKNPMEVLDQKQQAEARRSCGGCIHGFKMEFKSGIEMGCEKSRRWGKRCKFYEVQK